MTSSNPSLTRTILPLVILVLLGILASRYYTPPQSNPGPEIRIPGFDSVGVVTAFKELADAVGDANDVDSAQLAAAKVQLVTETLEGLDLKAMAAGPEKRAVIQLFNSEIGKVQTALNSVRSKPDVKAILDAALAPLVDRLGVFATSDPGS